MTFVGNASAYVYIQYSGIRDGVTLSDNNPSFEPTTVIDSAIGGNPACENNTPSVNGRENTVGGAATGQCAGRVG